jgi:hypothetical protein
MHISSPATIGHRVNITSLVISSDPARALLLDKELTWVSLGGSPRYLQLGLDVPGLRRIKGPAHVDICLHDDKIRVTRVVLARQLGLSSPLCLQRRDPRNNE